MTTNPPLGDRITVLRGALPALAGFEQVNHQASGDELGSVVTLLDTLAAEAARVRTAVIADPADGLRSGEDLYTRAGATLLSPDILRRIACNAHLVPVVLGSTGELLDQGREVRLFNRAQRRALGRRDRHCTFPGCDSPPTWTRAHHVLHWFDGGDSSMENAALPCEHHHTLVHTRRLWAEVRETPDEHGRHVVWDLSPGSYDLALRRREAERAAEDPPPLTPARWDELAHAALSPDPTERAWGHHLLPWYDPEPWTDDVRAALLDPLIWDDDPTHHDTTTVAA